MHAPRPKFEQHIRINKKERKAAIRHLLIEKILENKVHVLAFEPFKEPKTKRMAEFIKNCQLNDGSVLFLSEGFLANAEAPSEKFALFIKSMRNIPKLKFRQITGVSGYDVIANQNLVIMDSAIDQLKMLLGS